MATTKKYVSLEKLGLYDEKIKKVVSDGDAAALASAKSYADGLATNYDAAGSSATVQGNLDTEIARAKAAEEANAAAAKKAQDEVDALELVVAEKAAQSDLDNLEAYVGTIPEGATATNVVAYVQEKTAGIATSENLKELTNRVAQAETDIDNIEKDYLKAADKTELSNAIAAEAEIARAAEKANADAIDAIEADYLKAADKTELNNAIKANSDAIDAIEADYLKAADKTELSGLVTAEKERAEGIEAGLAGRIETMEAFWEAAQADGTDSNVIDTLKEIQEYIAGDESGASEMAASIKQNSDDIDVLEGKMSTVEGKLANIDADADVNVIEVVKVNGEALTVTDKAVDVIVPTGALASKDKVAEADLETALATKINAKADQTALDEAIETLEGADADLDERLQAVEAQLGDGENSVADLIATAKQEAIDAAAADAASKDAALETTLKKYADEEDAKIESRVDALETASATHALASDVTALAGRVTTAEGEIDTLQTEMDAVEALAAANKAAHEANAAAIALKAAQTDLDAAVSRIAAVETWQANMVECSEEDINGLFA